MSEPSRLNPTGRFTGLAEIYERCRPSYPAEALGGLAFQGGGIAPVVEVRHRRKVIRQYPASGDFCMRGPGKRDVDGFGLQAIELQVDGHDVVVDKRGSGPGLAGESATGRRARCKLRGQDLDSDRAAPCGAHGI